MIIYINITLHVQPVVYWSQTSSIKAVIRISHFLLGQILHAVSTAGILTCLMSTALNQQMFNLGADGGC